MIRYCVVLLYGSVISLIARKRKLDDLDELDNQLEVLTLTIITIKLIDCRLVTTNSQTNFIRLSTISNLPFIVITIYFHAILHPLCVLHYLTKTEEISYEIQSCTSQSITNSSSLNFIQNKVITPTRTPSIKYHKDLVVGTNPKFARLVSIFCHDEEEKGDRIKIC